MRQATTNFQLNADNIPVVVSNNCLQKNKQKNPKQTKQKQNQNKTPPKPKKKNKTNQNPGADCVILWS